MAGNQDALKVLLGKTIKGVIVKRDLSGNMPMGQIFLVFSDDTSFEIYSDRPILISSGLTPWRLEKVRSYLTKPDKGGDVRYMEVSLDPD